LQAEQNVHLEEDILILLVSLRLDLLGELDDGLELGVMAFLLRLLCGGTAFERRRSKVGEDSEGI
jgi:hypothetical protein